MRTHRGKGWPTTGFSVAKAGFSPLIVVCLLIFIASAKKGRGNRQRQRQRQRQRRGAQAQAQHTPYVFVQRSTFRLCYFRVHIPHAAQSPAEDPRPGRATLIHTTKKRTHWHKNEPCLRFILKSITSSMGILHVCE